VFLKQWEVCMRAGAISGAPWFHIFKHIWRALRATEDPLRHVESDRFLVWMRAAIAKDVEEERVHRLLRMRALADIHHSETLRVAPAVVGEVVDAVTTRALPSMFAWTCA
jgi:hypothetical protein